MYHHLNHTIGRQLYRSDTVRVGLFDCPRQHPLFQDTGPIGNDIMVFPRHTVRIRHTDKHEILADPQVVTLYNKGQTYRREAVAEYGDYSVWLHFPRELLTEAMREAGCAHRKMDRHPFTSPCQLSGNRLFLQQRLLQRYLLENRQPSSLLVEEVALGLLDQILSGMTPDATARRHRRATRQRHRQLAADCRELLISDWSRHWKLDELAASIGSTPFHLSRVFKAHIGQSIHQYLLQLRLRHAVDVLLDQPESRLTDLALDTGFATPSHFSRTFHKHFGVPPGRLNQYKLSKNWKVNATHST